MDKSLRRLLGIEGDTKRVYRFQEGEVDREEFEFCRVIDQVVFGEKGYVSTLGPTWELVHDPRFLKIEACFIHNRMAVFGGDARHGRQYMDFQGVLSSTVADLDQYSEIIGEGRHFRKHVLNMGMSPNAIKDLPNEQIWAIIKEECPNYFDQKQKPNRMARTLFQMFKEDLLGLIDDFAQEANVDQWVELDSLKIVDPKDPKTDPEEVPLVYLEIDLIEKALTYRASLRATAARVLKQLGLSKKLEEENYKLTDTEIDNLLRMIYSSNWPDDKPMLLTKLLGFMAACSQKPYEERLQKQLQIARVNAQTIAEQLRSGEIKAISQYTEQVVESPDDKAANQLDAILRDPLKGELFQMWVAAEQAQRMGAFEEVRHVFEDPKFELSQELFLKYTALLQGGSLPN